VQIPEEAWPYTESQNSPDRKKVRHLKSKPKCSPSVPFTARVLFTKNSSWQASQFCILLWHLMATWWKCAKTSTRNLITRNWMLHHDNPPSHISFFTRDFVYQEQHDCRLHPPYFSLFLLPKILVKLKGRHFDTIEVTEAKSQAVVHTLAKHDFQETFKKWQKHWERCIRSEGDYFENDGCQ
jgi:hypothetical protein